MVGLASDPCFGESPSERKASHRCSDLYKRVVIMPIYEYECPQCGRFEVIQKFSDSPLKKCPHCKEKGKDTVVEKAVSASAFHLKGTGWYKTDYGSSGSTGSAPSKKAESGTDTSTSSDSSGSSETKPAGKACGTGCGCH